MLYQPFIDPRFPERLRVYTRAGACVRVDYIRAGRIRAERFTMKVEEYEAFLEAAEQFKGKVETPDPVETPDLVVPLHRGGRKKKEPVDGDVSARDDGSGVS